MITSLLSKGVRYMVFSTIFFTLMQVFVKELKGVHVSQLLFFRALITWVVCFFLLRKNKIPIWGYNKTALSLRAMLGVISVSFFFITIQKMQLGSAVSLKYLAPLFMAALGVVWLKDRVKRAQWGLFIIALLGIYLIKNFEREIDSWYLTVGIIGAVADGAAFLMIRRIGKGEHSWVIIQYFMLFLGIVSGVAMIFYWQWLTASEWMMVLGIGISGYYSQLYITKAFQFESIHRVAPIKYLEVVYSLLIGWVWFDERYSVGGFSGVVLIIGAMFVNLLINKERSVR